MSHIGLQFFLHLTFYCIAYSKYTFGQSCACVSTQIQLQVGIATGRFFESRIPGSPQWRNPADPAMRGAPGPRGPKLW